MATRTGTMLRVGFAALLLVLLLMAENSPSSLRDNLCEWEWFVDCPQILLSEHIVLAAKFTIWVLIVVLLGWTTAVYLISDYRRTVTDIQQQTGGKPDISSKNEDELSGVRIDHVQHLHIHQDGTTKTATFQTEEPPPVSPRTAHVNFLPAQMYGIGDLSSIHSSSNISSITDNGVGEFTFTFSEPLDEKTLVAYPIGSTPQFRVVSVSKHSVSVKFDDGEPDEIGIRFDSRGPDDTTADKPKVLVRNMTAWAAVDYIIEESESGQKWHPANKEFFGCKAFSDAAEEGKLAVEGRPKYHADTADIPHTYWRVGQLNPVAYLDYAVGKHNRSDGGESEQSRSDVVPSTFTEYVGLRVNEDEVKKIWPKVNT